MDLKIRKFEEFLINYINSVDDLPVEVIRLVFVEILQQLEEKSCKAILAQQAELKQQSEVNKDAESPQ